MKVRFQIAECSLSYAKIVPASAMKACFPIAECSLFYAKIVIINLICKRIHIKRSFIHNFAAFSSIIMSVFKQGFF